MQTTLVATMLQSHMRPDVGQLSVELAVLRHMYVCSDVNMNKYKVNQIRHLRLYNLDRLGYNVRSF